MFGLHKNPDPVILISHLTCINFVLGVGERYQLMSTANLNLQRHFRSVYCEWESGEVDMKDKRDIGGVSVCARESVLERKKG